MLCMYDDGTRLAAEVSADVDDFFQAQARPASACWAHATVFQTRIRRNIRLAEAPSFGQSIFQYAPGSNGADDYQALAQEVDRAGGPRAVISRVHRLADRHISPHRQSSLSVAVNPSLRLSKPPD